jgi:hypothetical protein
VMWRNGLRVLAARGGSDFEPSARHAPSVAGI